MEYNPLLLLLDNCFGGLSDLSNLCWSYLPDNIIYCVDCDFLIRGNKCPRCIDFESGPGEYYLQGELKVTYENFRYKVFPVNDADRELFNLLSLNDRDESLHSRAGDYINKLTIIYCDHYYYLSLR